ncbi:MAG: type II/IV secretion system ATPase subunit, partial [Candidatus Nanoarchaeia archaeon]
KANLQIIIMATPIQNIILKLRAIKKTKEPEIEKIEKTEEIEKVEKKVESEVEKEEKISEKISEPEERAEKVEIKRIALPKTFKPTPIQKGLTEALREVYETYPLIKVDWKGIRYVVATATIRFNPITNQLIYIVEEPVLSSELSEIVSKTIKKLQERLEISPYELKAKKEVVGYVNKKIDEIWSEEGISLTDEDVLKAKYYIMRDTIGYGKIEPLMRDPNIEDISADGAGLPVFIFHRNPLYGEMSTNIWFKDKEEIDAFVMKLAQKAGKTISIATPLLDATLPDGSRLQATYGTDIARRGSNFSIRKFFVRPFTIIDLLNNNTTDPLILAYLWLAIEARQSILIAGTTAAGKTTFLNCISQFIQPNLKIITIEDTAELKLPQVNWIPQIARAGYGPKKYGEVTLFDLLKAALRQRPDVLIVGEVRGREASVMFQAMATGHCSLSTLHADSIEAVIDRLTTRPISLPTSLLQNLDIIVFLEKTQRGGKLIRRVSQVVEIEGYDRKKDELKTNIAFEWKPLEDVFLAHQSSILAKIAPRLGFSEEQIIDELMRRALVLKKAQEKRITGFRKVAALIVEYYTNPKELFERLTK